MTSSKEELILEKLDILIKLLALQISADRSVTEGVRALKLSGLDNKTIATVLNTTQATVRTLATAGRGRH